MDNNKKENNSFSTKLAGCYEKGELNFISSENFKINKTKGKDMKNGTVIKIVHGTGEKALKALSNAMDLAKEFSFNLKHKTETGIEGTILKYYMDSKTKVVYLDVEFEEEVAQKALELFIEDRFNQDSYYFIYPVKNKDVANRFSNYVKEDQIVNDVSLKIINDNNKEREIKMENENKCNIYLVATSISSLNILRANSKASNEVFKEMLTESINNLNASISIADISISDIKVVNIFDIKKEVFNTNKEKHQESMYSEVAIKVELNAGDLIEVVTALGNGYTTNGLLRLKNSTEVVAKLRSLRLGEAADINSSLITKDTGNKKQESVKTDKCKMNEDDIDEMINSVIDEALVYTPHVYALPVLKTLVKAYGLSNSVKTRLNNEIHRRHMRQNFRKHYSGIIAPNPCWPNSWANSPVADTRTSSEHVSPGLKTVVELIPIAKFSNIEDAKDAVDDIRNNKILKNEDLILKENNAIKGKCLNVFITARENNTYVVQVVIEFKADIANKYRDLINSKKDESKLKTIDSDKEEVTEEVIKPVVTVQLLNPFLPFGKVNKEKILENFMKEITEGKINLWLSYRKRNASTIATKIVDCKISSFKPNPFSPIQLDCYTLQVQFQSSEEALDYLEHLKNNRQESHFAHERAFDYPEYALLHFASIDYTTSPIRTIRRNDENYRDYSSCNISITLGEINKSISEIKNRLNPKKEETMSLIFTDETGFETIADNTDNSKFSFEFFKSLIQKDEKHGEVIKLAIPTEKFKRLKDATEFHKSFMEYLEKSEHPIIEKKLGNDYSAVFSKFYFIPTDFYLVERKEDEYVMFADALIPANLISKFGEEEFTRICNNIMDETKLEFIERKDETVDNKDITVNEKNKKYPLTVYLPIVKFLTNKEAKKLCKNLNKSIKKIKANNLPQLKSAFPNIEITEDDYVHLLPEIYSTENKEFHGHITKVEVVENHDGHFLVVANVKVSSEVKKKLGMKTINSIVINSINDVELVDTSKHKKVVVDEVYTKDLKDYLYRLKTVGNDKLMISASGYSTKLDNKVYDAIEISCKTIKDSNGVKTNKTKIIAKIVIE